VETGLKQTRSSWFVVLTLIVAIGTAAGFLWRAHVRREFMSSNERSAEAAFRDIKLAEADYRANDRDRNGVNDFWTADVRGLLPFGLISQSLAGADATRSNEQDRVTPFAGYLFAALEMDDSETPPVPYREDTDHKSGKVHNSAKFGFVAFPAKEGVTGRYIFIVNENSTVFWRETPCSVPRNWPPDEELKQHWRHVWVSGRR